MLVPPQNASFVAEPIPHLVVVASPHMEALPPLAVEDGVVRACEGWQLAARLTVTVVDGPGEAGFMIPGATDQESAEALMPWLQAVDEVGAAVVIALDAPPADASLEALVAVPTARGGVVAALPAGA